MRHSRDQFGIGIADLAAAALAADGFSRVIRFLGFGFWIGCYVRDGDSVVANATTLFISRFPWVETHG